MGTKTCVAIGLVLALGACSKSGQQGGGKEAATERSGTASVTPAAARLNPGEWETVSEITMAGLPANMPPSVANMMKGTKVTTRHCLTPEQAQRPSGDLFSGKHQENCTRQGFTMNGGRLQGSMTCKDPRGAESTVTMDGQYGGDSFDVTMKMTAAHEGQGMTWSSHTKGHRIGACPAGGKTE
jgi:hypothetical protein